MLLRFFAFCFVAFCLLLISPASAQNPDSIEFSISIPTIEITTARIQDLSLGQHLQHLDSSVLARYAHSSLSDILSLYSHWFIKDYGVGGLATLSGRGGGASQTAVLWEGIQLQNPMLGQTDLSLLPAFFIDDATIQYSGGSSLFGGNASNGALHLRQIAPYNRGWGFASGLQTGSFGDFHQQWKLQYGGAKFAAVSRVFYHTAQNDFRFRHPNLIGKPLVMQQNSALEQLGALQEFYFKLLKHHQFSSKTWFQHSQRQIAPSLLQTNADDRQFDQSLRSIFLWTYSRERFSLLARTAAIWERLNYESASVFSQSQILTAVTETEQRWQFSPFLRLQTGLHYSYQQAFSSGYNASPHQHRAALWAALVADFKKLSFTANTRAELVNTRPITPSFSVGCNARLFAFWQVRFSFSHNYRLPTFNDLYWSVLGNPLLKPEYSWNTEVANSFDFAWKKQRVSAHLGAYSQWVSNWILWLPDAQSGLWRPQNVAQVWSKGLECSFDWNSQVSRYWQFGCKARYALNSATNHYNRQLIYTPMHNASVSLEIRYRWLMLGYQHLLVSKRYITSDNSDFLPLYHLGNLELRGDFSIKKVHLSLYIRCRNVAAAQYQVVSQRAMPLQQWQVGVFWRW